MSGPAWWRVALQLMGLQAVLGGLAYLIYGYRRAAMAAGVIFLLAIWQVGAQLRGVSWAGLLGAALLAQLPGLVGTVNFLLEQARLYAHNPLGDVVDFLMETWHTVLLPLVRLLPGGLHSTRSGEELTPFFLALPLLSPLLIIWVILAARVVCR